MNHTLEEFFSFSIAIAAIIGGIRIRKINPAYYPFLFVIWLALLNEIISYLLIHNGHSNAVNTNIYALAESLLLTWQFKNWNTLGRSKILFVIIVSIFVLFWIVESFFISGINSPITYFRIFYSFAIVLMGLPTLSERFMHEKKNILKNSIFLVSLVF